MIITAVCPVCGEEVAYKARRSREEPDKFDDAPYVDHLTANHPGEVTTLGKGVTMYPLPALETFKEER